LKNEDRVFKTDEGNPLIHINKQGQRIDSIKNVWKYWTRAAKVKRDGISFKSFRKTGAQMIRQIGGREVRALYLSHVDSTVAGRHYDRFEAADWNRLGEALATMRVQLGSVFGDD
jgi:integrase